MRSSSFRFVLGVAAFVPLVAFGDTPSALRAMKDELNRQMKELSLPGLERPYYLEYVFADARQIALSASLGAIQDDSMTREGFLRVNIRVGSASFDQTGYMGFSGLNFFTLTFEDEYDALRHELWLATDAAYKSALESFSYKKAFEATRVKKSELPNFSKATPNQWQSPKTEVNIDREAWRSLVRDVSAVFKKYPEITDSWVNFSYGVTDDYFANSEGSEGNSTKTMLRLVISVQTRADDGMPLQLQLPFIARTPEELPQKDVLLKQATDLAEQLKALRAAKTFDEDYIGPILFEGNAAGQVIRLILSERFSATPPPQSEGSTEEEGGRGNFSTKLGKKVAPKFLSIEDDPTLKEFNKTPLLGAYQFDEEGVAAQKLTLVDKGILKNLVASRTPSKQYPTSNGHGRGSITIEPKGRISNLLVKADKGLSTKDIRKKATDLAKEAGLSYVIVVRSLAMFDYIPDYSFISAAGYGGDVPSALLAYKLYPNGKEELIRGVALSEIDLRSFQHLAAAGSEQTVHNFLSMGYSSYMSGSYSFEYPGFSIPTSIVAPSLLFDEAEVRKAGGAPEKPPILPHPIFGKTP